MNGEKHITIKELATLKGVSTRTIRLSKDKYITRVITVKGGKSFEVLLSSIEPNLQEKYYSKFVPESLDKQLPVSIDFYKPDKAKVIALARLELLNLWKSQRKNQANKTQFDNDFLSTYNAQVLYPEIYAKLGNVSIGTLQRWKRILGKEFTKAENKFEIINRNVPCINSDITVIEACEMFLEIKKKTLTESSFQAYKTFVYAKIIPYFKQFLLRDISISDIQNLRKYLQENKGTERRIKNILTLLNQIIKHFHNEGFIDKNCVFEVKRIADIPKRTVQILTPEQLIKLFKIIKKNYPYLDPIIQKTITQKQPLNTILTGNEQEKKSLKRKIRKDFYKIKQELGLVDYKLDDLKYVKY